MKRTHNNRKIKSPVLIISLVVIAFFIFIGWRTIYHSHNIFFVQQPSPTSTTTVSGMNSGTASTSTNTSSTLSLGINQPTPPPTPSAPPPLSAQNIKHVAGIAAGGGLSKVGTSTLNQQLDQMVNLGITWVRFDIEWGNVQYSSPDISTWGRYDTLVNAIAAHHLHGLGTISFTPEWARVPGCTGGVECPPADPATFATFAAQVAARYKSSGLHYWEIWNEPNNYNFWATKTDCNAYATLLKVTYPAIKLADPNAVVVTGGLAPETTDNHNTSPTDFLSCVYSAGGKNYFDAVGDHPYTFPQMPSTATTGAWNQMSVTSPSLRSIMVANGDTNKKIWMTEFGVPTNGPDSNWYLSEGQQAQMITDAFGIYKKYAWAGPLFWYSLQDVGIATDTNENFFGLVRYDGSTKPASTILKNIISSGL